MPASHNSSALPAPEILFASGEIFETSSALVVLKKYNLHPISLLARHLFGDWGDVSATEAHANDRALAENAQLVSSYLMPDGERLCIVTEGDRSVTRLMLPTEFRPCLALVGGDSPTMST